MYLRARWILRRVYTVYGCLGEKCKSRRRAYSSNSTWLHFPTNFGKLYSVIRAVRRVIYERRTDARTFLRRRADETLPMSCKASRKDRCLTGLPEGSLTRERLPGTFSQTQSWPAPIDRSGAVEIAFPRSRKCERVRTYIVPLPSPPPAPRGNTSRFPRIGERPWGNPAW